MERGIEIESLDFYPEENALKHRTQKYELVTDGNLPVLRRSQTFLMAITTKDRVADLDGSDRLTLIFEFGSSPSVPKDTKAALILDPSKRSYEENPAKWDVVLDKFSSTRTAVVRVRIGCAAPVGVWRCKMETRLEGSQESLMTHVHPDPIYVIFNPYSKEDIVFMDAEEERAECVENDVGKVWMGTYKNFSGKPWVFGQYEDFVLPACCFLLDSSGLKGFERGNPVKVSRAISAMVNSVDDNGIVEGRWSPPYDDGVQPWEWNGSAGIIEAYMKEKRPVKYGQCWVFSAVTVTICRALGLPCRSVTNYISAHDANSSLTVDKFFDQEGKELAGETNDSIWNFHVWNDVWMARPDLPAGYGGWQAIDATPQEASDGSYRCGPAPVVAVKEGEIGFGFDTPFVFAEVNADICYFVKDPNSPSGYKRTQLKKSHIGRLILTNDGQGGSKTITDTYKNKEATREERLAVFNAVRGIAKAMQYYDYPDEENEDVFLKPVEVDAVKYGSPFNASVDIENRATDTRTINAVMTASSVYYTGIKANVIAKSNEVFKLEPGQRKNFTFNVQPDEYVDKLVEYAMVKFHAMVHVLETNQSWSDEEDFAFEKPLLSVRVVDRQKIQLTFTNPLDRTLTDCTVGVECAGLIKAVREKVPDVEAGAVSVQALMVTPRKAGPGTVVACFSSKQMFDVHGSAEIDG